MAGRCLALFSVFTWHDFDIPPQRPFPFPFPGRRYKLSSKEQAREFWWRSRLNSCRRAIKSWCMWSMYKEMCVPYLRTDERSSSARPARACLPLKSVSCWLDLETHIIYIYTIYFYSDQNNTMRANDADSQKETFGFANICQATADLSPW